MTYSEAAALCERVLQGLPDLTQTTTRRIRSQMTSYTNVPLREHREAVRDQHRRRIAAIAEGRSMDTDDLQRAARLAQDRAMQGVPVGDLVGAYHIGDQELWERLCAVAEGVESALPQAAARMLESIHAITTVLASAHAEVTRIQQENRITTSQRFVELLATGSPGEEATLLAGSLGLDPGGPFSAMAWLTRADAGPPTSDLHRHLARVEGKHAVGYSGDRTVVISQGASRVALVALANDQLRSGAGFGHVRQGVKGAALSLSDALLALHARPTVGNAVILEADWLEATLLSRAEHLSPLLGDAVAVAAKNPRLGEALLAMSRHGMSLSGTASSLHIHVNTVKYRLTRWTELTGLDPRSFDGLALSVLSCHLARPRQDEHSTTADQRSPVRPLR